MAELDVRRIEALGNLTKIIQCKVHSDIARKEFLALRNDAIDLHALWRGISCSCICTFVVYKCLYILSTPVCWNCYFFHVKSCETTMYMFQLFVFSF